MKKVKCLGHLQSVSPIQSLALATLAQAFLEKSSPPILGQPRNQRNALYSSFFQTVSHSASHVWPSCFLKFPGFGPDLSMTAEFNPAWTLSSLASALAVLKHLTSGAHSLAPSQGEGSISAPSLASTD